MYEIKEDDSIHELCEKVFDTTISEILNVRSQIDQDVLENAIETLVNAQRVEFYAFGGSAPVAMDGQHKFFRLKIASSYISDPHLQFMSANSLEKDDVFKNFSSNSRNMHFETFDVFKGINFFFEPTKHLSPSISCRNWVNIKWGIYFSPEL